MSSNAQNASDWMRQDEQYPVYEELGAAPTYTVQDETPIHHQYHPHTVQQVQQPQHQQQHMQQQQPGTSQQMMQMEQSTEPIVERITDQERFLPISNVAKIMKRRVPDPCKVSKEAKEGVQEASSEFIQFIVSEAVERCQMEKRKTIGGDDILLAMNALGFDQYIEPLRMYLDKFRTAMRGGGVDDDAGVSAEAFGVDGGQRAAAGGRTSMNTTAAIVVEDEFVPTGVAQMVQIQMASADGTVRQQTVPLVSYVDPSTGQTYITLNTSSVDGMVTGAPTASAPTTLRLSQPPTKAPPAQRPANHRGGRIH